MRLQFKNRCSSRLMALSCKLYAGELQRACAPNVVSSTLYFVLANNYWCSVYNLETMICWFHHTAKKPYMVISTN